MTRPTPADLAQLTLAASGVDASRRQLAELAADWKQRGVHAWADVIGAHDGVRRAARTVREWATAAEYRRAMPSPPALPFSFFVTAARFADRLAQEDIADMMQEFEAEKGAGVEAFGAQLRDMAGTAQEPVPALAVAVTHLERAAEEVLAACQDAPGLQEAARFVAGAVADFAAVAQALAGAGQGNGVGT